MNKVMAGGVAEFPVQSLGACCGWAGSLWQHPGYGYRPVGSGCDGRESDCDERDEERLD